MPRRRSSRQRQRSDFLLLVAIRIFIPLALVLSVGSWVYMRSLSKQRCADACAANQLVLSDFSASDPMSAFTDGRCVCVAVNTPGPDFDFPENPQTNPIDHGAR